MTKNIKHDHLARIELTVVLDNQEHPFRYEMKSLPRKMMLEDFICPRIYHDLIVRNLEPVIFMVSAFHCQRCGTTSQSMPVRLHTVNLYAHVLWELMIPMGWRWAETGNPEKPGIFCSKCKNLLAVKGNN